MVLLCTSIHVPELTETIPQLLERTKPIPQLLTAQKNSFLLSQKGQVCFGFQKIFQRVLIQLFVSSSQMTPGSHQATVFRDVAQFSKLLLFPSLLLSCPSDASLEKPHLAPEGISEACHQAPVQAGGVSAAGLL